MTRGGWDTSLCLPEFSLDLPGARIMGAAIGAFLAEHETTGCAVPEIEDRDRRPARTQLAKPLTPKTRWLQDLRTELVSRLAEEVVTHSDSNRHGALKVRRLGGFPPKVVNANGGCVGVVRTDPDLVMVGSEFDRPAVTEALVRDGITVPFDPTPGWLNATLHRESDGWIHVVWVGRIAGLNVEPILASFDVTDSELRVFAAELDAPIQRLLRRAGHIPEKVLLRDHPRDPDQFFGQDLITRLESPQTVRSLRAEARALIPEEWAERIEARWRATQANQSRNAPISHTTLSSSPVEQRPPDDPQTPPGLIDPPSVSDADPDDIPCRLCGEALNPYAGPSPYCLDCVGDARSGLFVDIGFDEPWRPAVLWSLNQLAVLEFGGAPARDQLRKMPQDGPHADLLMLCRMLTARRGYVGLSGPFTLPNSIHPGIIWARVAPADLPLTAGPHVLILRAHEDADRADVEFALRFISSDAALTLSDDPRLPPATMTIGAAALAALNVPLPDAMLKDALASVDLARRRASAWSAEADDILDGLFEYDSAAQARQRVLERSRLVRLRMKAVDDVETLNGQVRTQYPLPIAYRWRVLEAARSHGTTRETYTAAIDAAEQALAFMANVGLALAREIGKPVSAAAAIKSRLARGQGTSMSDWCNVLDELAGRAFSRIDNAISTPEFRSFCAEPEVKTARQDLLRRRNDEAHGRRAELIDLGGAITDALVSLDTLNRSLAFLLDNPLVVARRLHWDTIRTNGALEYQQFAGDHAVVPIREMSVTTPTIEAGSLYLLDSKHSLHLLRPFLTGANCQRCGNFSVFCVDHRANGALTIKSLEHGHSIQAAEPLVHALAAVDLVGEV